MSRSINRFWWRWLIVVTLGVIGFSLMLLLAPGVTYSFFGWLLAPSLGANASFEPEAIRYITFIYGVLGAVMIGWSLSLLLVLLGPFRRGEREAWRTVAVSMIGWFLIDSGFSLAVGFAPNAALNCLFFLGFAIPLAATYRDFFSARP